MDDPKMTATYQLGCLLRMENAVPGTSAYECDGHGMVRDHPEADKRVHIVRIRGTAFQTTKAMGEIRE